MVLLCETVVEDTRAATPGRPGILQRLHPQPDGQWLNCFKGICAGAAHLYRQSKSVSDHKSGHDVNMSSLPMMPAA